MIADLSAVSAILMLETPILLLVMLLPSVIELKRPLDAGPRLITDKIPAFAIYALKASPLLNMEEEQGFDVKLIRPLANILNFLPKIDS